jgi:NADPH:quinone reductase-like Zn-dependent oxidoreductase
MAAGTPAAGAGGNDAGAREATMKAIVQHRYGPPGVLAVEEIVIPALGDDDVLIRVRAAALNAGDGFITRGVPYFMRLFAGLRRPRHAVRGVDVAGTVSAVGANVTGLRPGEEVLGSCGNVTVGGGFAEYARVPRGKVARKLPVISFEQAAAIPVAAVTALQALRDAGRVRPGQKVLINGASGGVGTFAVQIAGALGAQVTGVCSSANLELVRSLGAGAVIDYTREDFTRGAARYDVIVDNVANHRLTDLRRALTANGTLVPNANTSGRWLGGLGRTIAALVMAWFVPQRIRPFVGRVNQPDLDTITGLIEAGKIIPVIDRTYPLADVPEALGYLGQGHARGKIVITT